MKSQSVGALTAILIENVEGDSGWRIVCCDSQHSQQSPLVQAHQVVYISTDLCCFSMWLPAFFSSELCLSEAAKSVEGAQGDDGLHYRVTESQHGVPVLLELPGELQAPILFGIDTVCIDVSVFFIVSMGPVLFIVCHYFNLLPPGLTLVNRWYFNL